MDYIIGILLSSYKPEEVSLKFEGENIVFRMLEAWYDSISKIPGLKAIVLMDIIPDGFIEKYSTENVKFEKCEPNGELNAIDIRWKIYTKYLQENKHITNAFFSDVSDVLVLQNPFPHMQPGKIYTGDEDHFDNKPINITWDWMQHRWNLIRYDERIEQFLKKHSHQKVLNAGLVGGHRDILIPVISKMADFLDKYKITGATIDMNALNYTLYSEYIDIVVHGAPVNTVFWEDDLDNKICWFKHK